MIPAFDEIGFLPAGIHPATLDEIDARFGQHSELRRVQMESVRWMVEVAKLAGVERIILNGSLSRILLSRTTWIAYYSSNRRGRRRSAMLELEKGLPFLDIAVVRKLAFDEYIQNVFAVDRTGMPKGMIEVIQWN